MGKILKFLLIIILGIHVMKGQSPSVQMTIKVKAIKEYQELWDSILIINKDTTIRLLIRNSLSTVKALPQGHYSVILKSRINGWLKKEVDLKKSAVIEFNTLKYYKPYQDTISMLYKMKDGDTCFINYTNGVNKLATIEYLMIVKEGGKYLTIIKNEINQWWSIPIFEYELQEFIQYGKYEGPVKSNDNEGLGVSYWSLNKQVLRRSCGVCLYGLLLRKRLVRTP